jgi:SAM-dependent methyltransferase
MEAGEYMLMDAAEGSMWWYRALHARLLQELLPIRGQVLDAGCGTGGFLALLRSRRQDLKTIGLEWNANAALRACEKSGCPVVRGDVNLLPFASASFDAVVSADVLYHQAVQPPRALQEFFRVLRPGGLLVTNMPAYEWLRSAHDRRVLTARRVTRRGFATMLTNAGFAQVRAYCWNSLLLPLMILRRKLTARDPGAASDVAPFPPWLDAALYAVTALEQKLPLAMPVGGSVLATAVRLPEK